MFLLQVIRASDFESKIDDEYALVHRYPPIITPVNRKSFNDKKEGWLKILTGQAYNAFKAKSIEVTLPFAEDMQIKNASFFPEQEIAAMYDGLEENIQIYSTTNGQIIKTVPLDKSLTMNSFFLDFYANKESKSYEKKMYLLIFYKTKDVGVQCVAEISIQDSTKPPKWGLIHTSQVTAVKTGTMRYLVNNQLTYNDFINLELHSNKEDLDKTGQYGLYNQQRRPRYSLIIGGASIFALLLFGLWCKFL